MIQRCDSIHRTVVLALCLLLGACNPQAPVAEAGKPDIAAEPEHRSGVTLTAEEAGHLGIAVAGAAAAAYVPEQAGYAVALGHEAIAQAAADIASAEAAARQSRAAWERIQRLAGSPGAASTEATDSAQRQAATDAAAWALAQRKASSIWGQHPSWQTSGGGILLTDLARGDVKLLRVTFPLGSVSGRAPPRLRLARLDAGPGRERWSTAIVWDAPADASVPGRSFFAALRSTDVAEGERLLVWAATGAASTAEAGVLVPAAALVMSEGQFWVYIETAPHSFARTLLDTSRPLDDGYFVKDAIKPGAAIVISGAGLLLARETNPSTEAE